MKIPTAPAPMTDVDFLRWAELESCGSISAGSLAGVFERKAPASNEPTIPLNRIAFGSLISLERRRKRWTVEDLAARAEIDLDEAVSIEEDPAYRPEPRSVFQLAKVLTLPTKNLLVLSGNASARNTKLERAAVKFAARSRVVESLTEAELVALNDFVSALAEEEVR